MNLCGIDISRTLDNSTAYVSNWLSKLSNDSQLIISAAGQAQKRFDYLVNRAGLSNSDSQENETPKEKTEESVPNGEPVAVA